MKKIKIMIDTDGIIYDIFRYQMEKGLIHFKKIDNEITVDDITIKEIFKLEDFKDFQKSIIKYLEEYYKKTGLKIDYTKYDITEIFNCSHFRRQVFWLFNIYGYCKNSKIIDDIIFYINKWQKEGKEVYNATARVYVTDNNFLGFCFRKMLYDRYEKDGVKFDGIDLCSEENSAVDKFIACNKRQADFLIEDKANNACYVKENSLYTNVLLLDAPYNKKANFDCNLIINSFSEADKIIGDYEKELKQKLLNKSYIVNNKLVREKKKESLTREQLLDYYQQQKEFYKNLPYDKEKSKSQKKNYKKAYSAIIPVFNAYNNTKVINKDKIPYQKGVIFVSNHRGSLDQFAIVKALGNRPVRFVVHEKLLNLKRGLLYKYVDCIFCDPNNVYSRARTLKEIIATLSRNEDVFIFPEGTRNWNEYLLDFDDGAVMAAEITGSPIVPIALNDEYKFQSKGVIVRVEDPIIVQPGENISKINENLEAKIRTMIWENMEEREIRELESIKRKYALQKKVFPNSKGKLFEKIQTLENTLIYSPIYEEKQLKLSKQKKRRYRNF